MYPLMGHHEVITYEGLMPRLRYLLPLAVVTLFLLGVSLRLTEAQIDVETCPTIIEDALGAVGDNCGGMDRNSACYGFSDVAAAFSVAQPVSFFTAPSDRARLLERAGQ